MLAGIMFLLYCSQKTGRHDEDIASLTLGYGYLSAFVAAFASMFFAPTRMTWLKLSKKQEPVVVQQPVMPEKESSENVVSVKLEGKIPLNAIEKAP